jgi:hypothetical protein
MIWLFAQIVALLSGARAATICVDAAGETGSVEQAAREAAQAAMAKKRFMMVSGAMAGSRRRQWACCTGRRMGRSRHHALATRVPTAPHDSCHCAAIT